MVSTWDFGSYNSGSNPDAAVKRCFMMERTLLLDMLIKYINENGIKKTMELVLEAIKNSKGEV